jgi:hypothetical protein
MTSLTFMIQEERKDALRKNKRKKPERDDVDVPKTSKPFKASKKRVSFG